jgi:hypothetical protein
MKYVKMLGLAAIAAMALMAFLASSASATTLYSGTTKLPKGTKIESSLKSGTEATLTSTSGEPLDVCKESTVSGKTEQETASEITGKATVTWGTCEKETNTLNGGTLGITYTGSGLNGTVKSFGAEVTIGGLFGVSCVYGTSATGTTLGTLVGSTTGDATLSINTPVERKSGGFLCPASGNWVASYTVTSPSPLHVTN